MIERKREQPRTGRWIERVSGVAGAVALSAVSALMIGATAASAATVSITIGSPTYGPLDVLHLNPTCPSGSRNAGGFCITPASATATTTDNVTFSNATPNGHTLSLRGNSIPLAPGQSYSTTFPVANRFDFAVDGAQGTLDVTGNPPPAPTAQPAGPAPGATTSAPASAGARPGTVNGAGTAKPRIVTSAAPPPPAASVVQGPQGSSALPPVDPSAATPSPDSSALPPLSVPSPSPKAKPLATTSATTGLTRKGALYLTGAIIFGAIALGAVAFYGIRTLRRRRAAMGAPSAG